MKASQQTLTRATAGARLRGALRQWWAGKLAKTIVLLALFAG